MNLSLTTRARYAPPVEFVERKGAGHPDTICDNLADKLAQRLAREYVGHTGAVQAFNVDKAILAAGTAEVEFGGGRHITPARLILVGKADMSHGWEPDRDALVKATETELAEILPDAVPDAYEVDIWLGQSSADLAVVLSGRGAQVPLSNDTSFAAVSLPRSPLEQAVHDVEHSINSADFREMVPVGRDIKVMGQTSGSGSRLTVAAPIMSEKVFNRGEYDEAVAAVRAEAYAAASQHMGEAVDVRVNQADADDSPYLVISGTSAEAGDDGQVGRGNRFGGLITPYRPMSLEAAAGKNPAAHVGKTYHAVAHDAASRLLAETAATETTIRMLSSIGSPVTEPQATHIEIVGDVPESTVAGIVTDCLNDWQGVRDRLIDGYYELY